MSEDLLSACLHFACPVSDCSHHLLKEVKLDYSPIDDIGALGHYPERIGKVHPNCSHCPTSSRSVADNPSLEGCDPPLIGKPTLPSMELSTVKGTPSKINQAPKPLIMTYMETPTRMPDPWPVSGWVR